MDYEVMLDFHKQNNADVTIAVMPVPMEEASRFGIVVADEENRICEFQEKPAEPKSNLIDMVSGQDQYIFRIVTVYVFHILINSIRCTGIPFTSATFLLWLQNRNTTVITIQIPRNTNTDMRI